MAFQGKTRRPPVRWLGEDRWQAEQIRDWASRNRTGRALQQAIDDFWRESEPLLADPASACPEAWARWPAEQERMVARIETMLARRRAAAQSEARR